MKSNLAEYQYQSGPHPALWSQAVTLKDWKGSWRYKEGDEALSLKLLILSLKPGGPLDCSAIPNSRPPSGELPPRSTVIELQREVLAALTAIRTNGSYHHTLPPAMITFAAFQDTDEVLCIGVLETPQALFAYNLAFILTTSTTRLRQCEECKQWYYADRKNKAFCSAKCQSNAGTRRYREALERKQQVIVKTQVSEKSHDNRSRNGGKHGTKR